MRKSKFTESQIAAVLSKGEAGIGVAQMCCDHGVSDSMNYQWKRKYSGIYVSELKRVKELEAENSRLKRM